MSKLNDLIKELCPYGVEYKKIGDICVVLTGGEAPVDSIKSKEPIGDKIYPIYSNGIGDNSLWGFSNVYRVDRDSVTFSSIGTIGYPTIRRANFTPIIRLKVIYPIDDKFLNLSFLKYALEIVEFDSQKSSVPNINANMIKEIEIPVPPLPIQEEIVRILDNFTELTAELTAELQDRKKQYKYYRDSLLTFNNDIRLYKLKDVATFNVGVKPDKILEEGNIKYINAGTTESGFTVDSNTVGDTVTTPSRGQGGIGYVGYQYEPFWCGPLCYRIRSTDNNKLINKYLYYFMCSRKNIILEMKHEGGVPALNGKELGELLINVPSLEIQERIVNVLDNFEKICNDLKIGLPAEIELRQKQYEYYRDMLLTFPENDLCLSKQASKQASIATTTTK